MTLEIRVQSPRWAAWDRIEIYSNAGGHVSAVPVSPGARPTSTRRRRSDSSSRATAIPRTTGDGDFDISVVNVAPGVPGAERLEATVTRTLHRRSRTATGSSWS